MLLNIDIDGVIRNITDKIFEIYHREYPEHNIKNTNEYSLSKWFPIGHKIYNFIYKQHVREIFEEAPIYSGALDMLIQLQQGMGHKIQLVSYQKHTSIKPTLNWLLKHKIPFDSIHFIPIKWAVLGDILLDDCADNLIDFTRNTFGTTAVCFDQPWNQDWDGFRIKKHSEIINIIDYHREMSLTKSTISGQS